MCSGNYTSIGWPHSSSLKNESNLVSFDIEIVKVSDEIWYVCLSACLSLIFNALGLLLLKHPFIKKNVLIMSS